jgi:hypothetical protein
MDRAGPLGMIPLSAAEGAEVAGLRLLMNR